MFLSVQGINKKFDDQTVLKDISIDIEKGEMVSILVLPGAAKRRS